MPLHKAADSFRQNLILATNKSSSIDNYNQFYRMATDSFYPLRKVTRTLAYQQGWPVYHPITRKPIDPRTARALAQNTRSYDQNFECLFEDKNKDAVDERIARRGATSGGRNDLRQGMGAEEMIFPQGNSMFKCFRPHGRE